MALLQAMREMADEKATAAIISEAAVIYMNKI